MLRSGSRYSVVTFRLCPCTMRQLPSTNHADDFFLRPAIGMNERSSIASTSASHDTGPVRTPANTPNTLRSPAAASLKLPATPSRHASATYSPCSEYCLDLSTSGPPEVPLLTAKRTAIGPPSQPTSTPLSDPLMLMPDSVRTNAPSSCRRQPNGRYKRP